MKQNGLVCKIFSGLVPDLSDPYSPHYLLIVLTFYEAFFHPNRLDPRQDFFDATSVAEYTRQRFSKSNELVTVLTQRAWQCKIFFFQMLTSFEHQAASILPRGSLRRSQGCGRAGEKWVERTTLRHARHGATETALKKITSCGLKSIGTRRNKGQKEERRKKDDSSARTRWQAARIKVMC